MYDKVTVFSGGGPPLGLPLMMMVSPERTCYKSNDETIKVFKKKTSNKICFKIIRD